MSQRKICVFTGARSDYGLLYPLLKRLQNDPLCELQLIVAGMHLSPEFGMTIDQIRKDGFKISKEIECLLSGDTPSAVAKSMGLTMMAMGDAFKELSPDIFVVLGDRFESFAAGSAAAVARIPIVHLHGGETTEGAVDEAFRHALTKMSYWHFTCAEPYRQRVLQMGESDDRTFNVGALAVDHMKSMQPIPAQELEKSLGISLERETYLATLHPVTQSASATTTLAQETLQALRSEIAREPKLQIIFTLPNADAEGRSLIQSIKAFQQEFPHNVFVHASLGSARYLSLLPRVCLVIGNSSSGLFEAPYFRTPSIDIGDRQKGRIRPDSVIHCEPLKAEISQAIQQAKSSTFREKAQKASYPFGSGDATERICQILLHAQIPTTTSKTFINHPTSSL